MTCPSPEVLPPVGAFGGTFDPFHRGHLRLACAFRDELGLAEVRVIPTGASPHRPTAPGWGRRGGGGGHGGGSTGIFSDIINYQSHP